MRYDPSGTFRKLLEDEDVAMTHVFVLHYSRSIVIPFLINNLPIKLSHWYVFPKSAFHYLIEGSTPI